MMKDVYEILLGDYHVADEATKEEENKHTPFWEERKEQIKRAINSLSKYRDRTFSFEQLSEYKLSYVEYWGDDTRNIVFYFTKNNPLELHSKQYNLNNTKLQLPDLSTCDTIVLSAFQETSFLHSDEFDLNAEAYVEHGYPVLCTDVTIGSIERFYEINLGDSLEKIREWGMVSGAIFSDQNINEF